jgi:hypothetical protein
MTYPILGAVAALIMFLPALIGIYVDYLWFTEVGYVGVFFTILKTKIALASLGAAFFFVITAYSVKIAFRNTLEEDRALSNVTLTLILLFALLIGYAMSAGWELTLLFFNSTPFGILDPVFKKDISFYLFILPFYKYIWSIVFYGLVAVTIISGIIYFLYGKPLVRREPEYEEFTGQFSIEFPQLSREAIAHLAALVGALLLILSFGYILDRYSILYSTRGVVHGAGYADIKIQLPLLSVLSFVSIIASVLVFISTKKQDLRLPVAGIALLVVVGMAGNLFVGLVHQYKVEPDEFNLEKPYINYNIEYTLKAYDLQDVKEVEFPARYDLTLQSIQRNNLTIDNIRLWDWQPLLRTYRQVQLIRTYYEFNDVDIDRYDINGNYRQVMVGAREFKLDALDDKSKTWVNEHLFYTHGYGIAMSPVRFVSREGLPVLYIKDIPPKSEIFKVERPEIYYGELPRKFAVVDTTTKEFDYPKGEENVYTIYRGRGGISLNSMFRKAAMSMYYGTIKLFVSESITPDSKILIRRDIRERASSIAPFLKYDRDPYIVLSGGRLYWIHDAYTVSNKYPYSEPFENINYIRNSVKVITDAYDGTINFYVTDAEDPLIKTYMKIFPSLFKTFSEMPQDLRKHIRYPEDLFSIQASKYAVYHMRDPRVFYNKEDVWEIPNELYEGNRITMDPYYIITKLPQEKKEEFILLLPFTPRGKDNMIAWMAARSDIPRYGEKIVYTFPKEKLIYGPMQIEARIDQDPEISQLFTLWSQVGTRVIRGNLLAIPIEDSLLYIEPIYLRAEQPGALPELKRVIVAFGDRLTMQDTLDASLEVLFGKISEEKSKVRHQKKTSSTLIDEAVKHYEKAQEYMRQGNWSGYGVELEALKSILMELKQRQGGG